MSNINDLVEWSDCGATYNLYVKHYIDDEGRKGMTMIFEDLTHQKVTEMVVPPRAFPSVLKAINGGRLPRNDGMPSF